MRQAHFKDASHLRGLFARTHIVASAQPPKSASARSAVSGCSQSGSRPDHGQRKRDLTRGTSLSGRVGADRIFVKQKIAPIQIMARQRLVI
jgi:hypothetical protein